MALMNSDLLGSVSPRKIGLHQFKEELVEKMLNLPKPKQHPRPQGLKQNFLTEVQKPQTQGEDVLGVIQNLTNKKRDCC